MATVIREDGADRKAIADRKVAVMGYGSQGHAHVLNLRDSGIDVRVGLREGSSSFAKVEAEGVRVMGMAPAAVEADIIMMLTPDTEQDEVFTNHVLPGLEAGNMVMFAHGFAIRTGLVQPPDNVDVTMIAPKGPGHLVREEFVAGGGVPCLVAVHQDATGSARDIAVAYGDAIGGTKAGLLDTTFTIEYETDLFGEQHVLVGGLIQLAQMAYEVLVDDGGYPPEAAYFETMHELKLVVDLVYRGGINGMMFSISDTAKWGGLTSGPKIVNEDTREAMRAGLRLIRNGEFARDWIEECKRGRPRYTELMEASAAHPSAEVGRDLRTLMPFINQGHVAVEDASGGGSTTNQD